MEELIKSARLVPSLFNLEGKTALITGAIGGLGNGISMAMASAGADVVMLDRDKDKLHKLSQTIIREFYRKSEGFVVDITDEIQVADVVNDINKKFGKIDLLINCAGVAVLGPALDMPIEDWRRGMRINLEGTFICCREVGRVMVEQKSGKIINISSVRGTQGRSGYTSYAPSKAGVNLLTKSLACEWAEFGINVNAIAPIFIRTEMNAHILDDPEIGKEILGRIPIGRLGRPSDLFGAVIYLASSASDFVTGTVLYVDGGWTAA